MVYILFSVLVLFVLVLFVSSLNNRVALFYVCVVCFLLCNKTRWFSCLHVVVLFLFMFFVSFLSKTCKKPDTATPPPPHQKDNQKTPNFFQLSQLCSQIVFLIFGGWASKCMFAENAIKLWFQHIVQQPTMAKKCQTLKVNNWSNHKSKLVQECCPFFKNLIPAERRRYQKPQKTNKETRRKSYTSFYL